MMARIPAPFQRPPYENEPTYRDDNVILGLFAREGYERHDTSRQCCDGRCDDNQGRGGCPRVPESMPKKAPRIPRIRMVPERRVNPFIRRAVFFVVGLLCLMACISIASIQVPL